MTRTRLAISVAAGLLATVAPAAVPTVPAPAARARAEIASQVAAWNRGDLEAALQAYCPSDDIAWVNRSGISRGYDPFAQSMRAEFSGGTAAMGALAIAVEDARDLDQGSSLVVVRWSITRGGARLMGGISSQLWAECEGRMRVVFEHAS